jgi:hypothetical protein
MAAAYTAPPITVDQLPRAASVQLVFSGVEQGGQSFEGRVFLNHPNADERTERTAAAGYAGSFHVYGFGTPAPPSLAQTGPRPAGGVVAPIEKHVRLDQPVLGAALASGDQLTVTVVVVPAGPGDLVPQKPFEQVELVAR